MADRTSANLFAEIFKCLAKNPTEANKKMAREFWELRGDYDFAPDQMYAEEACMILGLCRVGIDPRYPDDGEVYIWYGKRGFEDCPAVETNVQKGRNELAIEVCELLVSIWDDTHSMADCFLATLELARKVVGAQARD